MSDIKIDGLEQLINKLKRVREDSDRVIGRALMKGGERVRSRGVLLCPVDTGALRDSIQVEHIEPLTVSVGTNIEYAVFVEYGTGTKGDPAVPHTSKKFWFYYDEEGEKHICFGQKPQPFLRPAAAAERENVEKDVADAVRGAING